MATHADQILGQLRALTPAERLRVVERIVCEVADEMRSVPAAATSIRGDESDEEFEAFQAALKRLRAADVWRAGDAPSPC